MRPPLPIVKTYRLFQIKVGRRCWSRAPTWDWVSPSRLLLSYRWGLGRLKNVEEVEGWGSFERIVRIQVKIYVSPTFDESPGPSEVFFTNMRSMSMLLVSWSSCVDSCELIEVFISYDETGKLTMGIPNADRDIVTSRTTSTRPKWRRWSWPVVPRRNAKMPCRNWVSWMGDPQKADKIDRASS